MMAVGRRREIGLWRRREGGVSRVWATTHADVVNSCSINESTSRRRGSLPRLVTAGLGFLP